VRVDLVIAVMAIQCGLVAAGALGILMLIILPGHVYLLGEPFVVCQFTDGGQYIMSMIDPKCSSPMI
jgi:hypothetical protein